MSEHDFTNTTRIENFSDAVIAIIITIMVLEFRLPEHALDQGLWTGIIVPIAPKVLSYALSFVLLTSVWIGHHTMMQNARFATPSLMWSNNHLLFWLSLVPFVTATLGDRPFAPTAVALYGAVLTGVSISFTFVRWLAIKESNLPRDLMNVQYTGLRRAMIGTLFYVAAMPLAFVSVYVSLALFVAVPSMFFAWHIAISKRLLAGAKPSTARP